MIIISTIAVYAPVISFDFINFDDPYFIYENEHVKNGLTIEGLRWAFLSSLDGNWIPLTWFSHMLDVQLFGMRSGLHHMVNVLLHAANSGLIFYFLVTVTGSLYRSATVALLFAMHPLHVESVAWVAERKDVLSTFFFILTLLAYHRYVVQQSLKSYLTTLLLFSLGLMSKSMLVTAPIILMLLDYHPLRSYSGKTIKRLLLEKLPFFALSVTVGIITYSSHTSAKGIVDQYTLWVRVARSLVSYEIYLQKTFLPLNLAIIYPFNPYPPTSFHVAIASSVLVLITAGAIILRQRIPFLLVGWLWFLVSLAPVIGFVQIGDHAWADRYFYIPSIGLFAAIVWGISAVFAGKQWRITKIFVASVSLAIAVVLTSIQLQKWRDSITLFNHAVKVTSNNGIAYYNLGLALYHNGRTDESIEKLRRVIEIWPQSKDAYFDLGSIYRKKGDFRLAEEIYKQLIAYGEFRNEAYLALGRLYLEMRDVQMASAVCANLRQADSPMAETLFGEINLFRLQNGLP